MTNTHPNRRTAVPLPSKSKHLLLAACALMVGFSIPVIGVTTFGNAQDARTEGSLALAPIPQVQPIAALNDETLDTPDLLAGDVPEGVNPTETMNAPEVKPAPKIKQASPRRIDVTSALKPLPKAPIAGLTRRSTFGPVPSKALGNSLMAYRRPFKARAGKQPVSLIVGGLGVNRSLTQNAIDTLPADVTLSFAAHSVALQDWVNRARADGHEVLIEIPMESANFDPTEPGANRALRISLSPAENRRRLDWMLSRAQGYAGVINFNGDSYLTRTDIAAPYMDMLSQAGIGFLTDGAFETPSLPALANSVGQPFKTGHGLIDPDPIPRVISARLSGLSQAAKSGSHPVGVGFAYPATLAEVKSWVESLDAQNLQLAPATAALK